MGVRNFLHGICACFSSRAYIEKEKKQITHIRTYLISVSTWGLFYAAKLETCKVWRTPNEDMMYSSDLKTTQHINPQRRSVNTECKAVRSEPSHPF